MVLAASGRMGSSRTSTPAGAPSTATNTVREPSSWARRRAALAQAGAPVRPTQAALPTATGSAADEAPDALAGHLHDLFGQYQLAVVGDGGVRPRRGPGRAARPGRASRPGPGSHRRVGCRPVTTAARAGRPLVRVPGLVDEQGGALGQAFQHGAAFDRRCPAGPPGTGPTTSATGAARISGQGVATTSTATARAAPPTAQATPAVTRVTPRNHRA